MMRAHADRKRRGGAVAVEMAFLLPLFIMAVFAQIEWSRLGMVTQLLTNAAREGCRRAVIDGSTQADVQAAVEAALANSGVSVGTVSPTPSNWQTAPGGTLITVAFTVPYSQVAWIQGPLYFNVDNVRGSATMSSERP
jgi:Flp pilus assembly protein TadG